MVALVWGRHTSVERHALGFPYKVYENEHENENEEGDRARTMQQQAHKIDRASQQQPKSTINNRVLHLNRPVTRSRATLRCAVLVPQPGELGLEILSRGEEDRTEGRNHSSVPAS